MQYSPKKTNNGTYQVAASVSLSLTRALLRVQPFKHQGKERIEFAGNYLHDHGARMAHNAIGRWSVMDPLMEKYYPVSPYVYCGNNPVSFVDKDGRRIVVTGSLSTSAVSQIQAAVGSAIEVSANDKGEMSYTTKSSDPLEGNAKIVAEIIDNDKITTNMATTDKYTTSTNNLFVGGAFMGNTVTENEDGSKSVSAQQEINPKVLGTADDHTKTPGKMIMHELTEAYEGAKMSQKTGVSSPRQGLPGNVYDGAHKKATPQTPVEVKFFNASGVEVPKNKDIIMKIEWSVAKDGIEKIIQKIPKE